MALLTFEGFIENGQIRLNEDVTLPERTRVYAVIPELEAVPRARIYSPRLARPERAADFSKRVLPVSIDAEL